MNIHLPAILMFTRGTRFWHTAKLFHCFAQEEFNNVLDAAPAVLPRSKSHVTLKSEAPKSEAAKSEAAKSEAAEEVPVPHQVPEVPEPVKPSAAPKVEETWSRCFF